jgi:butyryl-CoA dehydrogenase
MAELSTSRNKMMEQAKAFARVMQGLPDTSGDRVEAALSLYRAFARKGYHALLIPAGYGGRGLDALSAGMVYETLSYGAPGTLAGPLTTAHCAFMVMSGMQSAVHEKTLKAMAGKLFPAAFCLTEESAGSDIASIGTTARKQGCSFVISGTKSIVINHAIARTFIVFAAMPPARGRAALNAFVVDADVPGIIVGEPYDTLGFPGGVMGSVRFEDVRVPQECLLGEQGSGYLLFMETLDRGRPLVAASCVGEAQRALDLALEHTRKRSQFGRQLKDFQAVSFTLAELATRVHASRLLYQDALVRIDEGRPFTMGASMAKFHAAETLSAAASFGMDMLGSRAVSTKTEMERIFHNAHLMQAIDGTANVQRMVIASQL